MTLSKKDYDAMLMNFRQALADCDTMRERQIVVLTAARFVDYASRDNKLFDSDYFLSELHKELV